MSVPPITRIALLQARDRLLRAGGPVEGDATPTLTFKQAEVCDVLKSLLVLDLDGGHVAAVSHDS
jgi:hypothetical protein